jgi:hypothetical protein
LPSFPSFLSHLACLSQPYLPCLPCLRPCLPSFFRSNPAAFAEACLCVGTSLTAVPFFELPANIFLTPLRGPFFAFLRGSRVPGHLCYAGGFVFPAPSMGVPSGLDAMALHVEGDHGAFLSKLAAGSRGGTLGRVQCVANWTTRHCWRAARLSTVCTVRGCAQ